MSLRVVVEGTDCHARERENNVVPSMVVGILEAANCSILRNLIVPLRERNANSVINDA